MAIVESRLSFSFPKEMKDNLKKLAKADNRTMSAYIRNVLQIHIENNITGQEQKPKPTKMKRTKPLKRKKK
jgi:hypothetical protein